MPGRRALQPFSSWMQSPGPLGYNDAADPNRPSARSFTNTQLDWDALRSQIIRSLDQASWSGAVFWNALGKPVAGFNFALDRHDAKQRLAALGLDFEAIKSGRQRLTQPHMFRLLEDDLHAAVGSARERISRFDDLPEEKQRAIATIIFHLGADAFGRFTRFIDAIETEQFWEAAQVFEASRLHDQLGLHGQELAAQLRGVSCTR